MDRRAPQTCNVCGFDEKRDIWRWGYEHLINDAERRMARGQKQRWCKHCRRYSKWVWPDGRVAGRGPRK